MIDDLVSHTHDEPDHDDDRSAGVGIFTAGLLGALIFGACAFAVFTLAFVASKVLS
jgi:hypothetical protein